MHRNVLFWSRKSVLADLTKRWLCECICVLIPYVYGMIKMILDSMIRYPLRVIRLFVLRVDVQSSIVHRYAIIPTVTAL